MVDEPRDAACSLSKTDDSTPQINLNMSAINRPRVVPAHLSYLAIYNPSLGPNDESLGDQIVFYYSRRHDAEADKQRKEKHEANSKDSGPSTRAEERQGGADVKDEEEREKNERLRQVGLAQGMVDFVK